MEPPTIRDDSDCTRECPVLEIDVSLGSDRVVGVPERLAGTRGLPRTLVCDYRPEFHSRPLYAWAFHRVVHMQCIRPGRPIENAHIESSNGRCGTSA